MKSVKALAAVLALALLTPLAHAQTVEEVIAKGLDAIGGKDAYMTLDTLVMKGTISMPAMGMEMPFVTYQKRPGKMRYDADYQGMIIIQATDGEIAWGINPFAGSTDPVQLPPDQAKMFIRQADFDAQFFNFEERGITVELVGTETIEEKDYHLVSMVWNEDGMRMDQFFDVETGLLTYIKYEETGVSMTTKLSDYRDCGNGTLISFLVEQTGGMQGDMVITVEEVVANSEVDDALFAMPEPEPEPEEPVKK